MAIDIACASFRHAISNTPIEHEHTEGAMKTYEFEQTKPLPSYLVAFAVVHLNMWMRAKQARINFPFASLFLRATRTKRNMRPK